MTETETVQTAYGDVEIELEACDSCGTRVPTGETIPFEIGDRTGVACEVCRDEGPVSFPGVDNQDPWWIVFGLFAAFGPLAAVLGVMVILADPDADKELVVIHAAAVVGTFLWTVGGLFIASNATVPF